MIQLLGSATSSEGYQQITERLQIQMGQIAVFAPTLNVLDLDGFDPEFNRAGLHALMGRSPPQKDKAVLTEG